MKGIFQALFLTILAVVLAVAASYIGVTSMTTSEALGRSIFWGFVIGWSAVLIWEAL